LKKKKSDIHACTLQYFLFASPPYKIGAAKLYSTTQQRHVQYNQHIIYTLGSTDFRIFLKFFDNTLDTVLES
jgi:hypothetical protein